MGIRLLVITLAFPVAGAAAVPLSLFNGHDLEGWQASGEIEWRAVDGAIEAQGSGKGFLSTAREYGDFRLRLEFWVDASTNSGVFIRCRDRSRIHPETCYELNIYDEHPRQEARTGAIVFRVMPPLAHVDTVGRWNTLEVSAVGTSVELKINGVVTAIVDDADTTPGFIALQHWEQGTVRFREIELFPN